MTPVDIAIVAVIALSALVSLVRGAVREVISLAAWVVSFAIALMYADTVARHFAGLVHVPWLRYVLSFVLLLVTAVLLASLAGRLLAMAVKSSGLGWTDRLLGMVFGLARGLIVVAVLTVLIGAMPVQQAGWWKQSRLLPYFNGATQKLMAEVPRDDIARAVRRPGAK
mgnify:CR=1 FL=1